MKPIQLKNMKRTNCWTPKGKVWYQKNDDEQLGRVVTVKGNIGEPGKYIKKKTKQMKQSVYEPEYNEENHL